MTIETAKAYIRADQQGDQAALGHACRGWQIERPKRVRDERDRSPIFVQGNGWLSGQAGLSDLG